MSNNTPESKIKKLLKIVKLDTKASLFFFLNDLFLDTQNNIRIHTKKIIEETELKRQEIEIEEELLRILKSPEKVKKLWKEVKNEQQEV